MVRGMAEHCNACGDRLGVLQWYEKVVPNDPRNYRDVIPERARLHYELGQFEKAATLFRQAYINCQEDIDGCDI